MGRMYCFLTIKCQNLFSSSFSDQVSFSIVNSSGTQACCQEMPWLSCTNLNLFSPRGTVQPPGSARSWVYFLVTACTGEWSRRDSLMHMVVNGRLDRSSLWRHMCIVCVLSAFFFCSYKQQSRAVSCDLADWFLWPLYLLCITSSHEIHHLLSALVLVVGVARQIVECPANCTGCCVVACGEGNAAIWYSTNSYRSNC